MSETRIVTVKLDDIKLDPRNAYTHSDAEIQRLTASIGEHGFLEPVVLDEASMTLVGGEGRVEAARLAHLEEVPAVLTSFDPVQRKAVALALNGNYGTWDDERLTETLRELSAADYDLDLTSVEPYRLEELLGADEDVSLSEPFSDDRPPEYECPQCHFAWSGQPNTAR